jgi:hypothetical protein
VIYAFSTDDRTLHVHVDAAKAVAACEGYDVATGVWLFYAADGQPLEPRFSEPATSTRWTVTHGRYELHPASRALGATLDELLDDEVAIEGGGGLSNAAEVRRAVAAARARS